MEDKQFEQALRLLLTGLRKRLNGNETNLKKLLDDVTVQTNNELNLWDYYQEMFFEEENRLKKELSKYSTEELKIIKGLLSTYGEAGWDSPDEREFDEKYGGR